MPELTLTDYVTELRLDVSHLSDIVEEVERSIAEGNLDGAALVLATQTSKIGRFTEAYGALEQRLLEDGADPDRAPRSDKPNLRA
jgi:hypothetical protein